MVVYLALRAQKFQGTRTKGARGRQKLDISQIPAGKFSLLIPPSFARVSYTSDIRGKHVLAALGTIQGPSVKRRGPSCCPETYRSVQVKRLFPSLEAEHICPETVFLYLEGWKLQLETWLLQQLGLSIGGFVVPQKIVFVFDNIIKTGKVEMSQLNKVWWVYGVYEDSQAPSSSGGAPMRSSRHLKLLGHRFQEILVDMSPTCHRKEGQIPL